MSPSGASATEQLLLKFGLDLSPLKEASAAVKATIQELNKFAADIASGPSDEDLSRVKEMTDALLQMQKLKQEQANAEAAVNAKAMQEKLAAQQIATEAARTETEEARKETAEIEKQLALLREKNAEKNKEKHHEEGGLGEMLQKFATGGVGIMGGGLAQAGLLGLLGGGTFALAEKAVDHLLESIEHLKEALEEAFVTAEKMAKPLAALENIAQKSGTSAEKVMEELDAATGHVVNNMTLLQYGMTAMNNLTDISTEKMAEWAKSASDAATAMGHTREEGINALSRAIQTGQTRMLAHITGIRALKDHYKQAAPAFSEAADRLRKIDDVMGQINTKLEGMEKVSTIKGAWAELSKQQEEFFVGFFIGAQKSVLYKDLVAIIKDLATALELVNPLMEKLGSLIGDIAGWVVRLQPLYWAFRGILVEIKGAAKAVSDLYNEIRKLMGLEDEREKKKQKPEEEESAQHMQYAAKMATMDDAILQAQKKAASEHTIALLTETKKRVEEQLKLEREAMSRGEGLAKDHQDRIAALEKDRLKSTKDLIRARYVSEQDALHDKQMLLFQTTGRTGTTPELIKEQEKVNAEIAASSQKFKDDMLAANADASREDKERTLKDAQELIKLHEEQNKRISELDKAALEDRRSANEAAYHRDRKGLEDYFADRRSMEQAEHEATEQDLIAQRQLHADEPEKVAEIDKQIQLAHNTARQKARETDDAEEDAKLKRLDEHLKQELEITQSALKEQKTANEEYLKSGLANWDDYYQEKLRLIDANRKAELDHIDALKIAHAGEVHYIEQLNYQRGQIERKYAAERLAAEEAEGKEHLAFINERYGMRQQIAQAKLAQFQAQPGMQGAGAGIIENEIEVLKQKLAALPDVLAKSPQLLNEVRLATIQLNTELKKLELQLIQMKSVAYAASTAFQGIGNQIGKIFTSPFAQNLAKILNIGAGAMRSSVERRDIMATPWKRDETGAFVKGSENMTLFVNKLGAAVGAVGDFVTAITQAQSAIAGGLGGAMSGGGLGGMIGQTMGSLFKSIGKMGGPIGEAVGMVVGGVMGAITGSKNAAIKRNIDQLKNQMQAIQLALKENANNIAQTITQIQGLINQARMEQAQSKKGGEQYQKVIDDYSQQLQDLQVQQQGVIRDMNQQLAILQAPLGGQDFLKSLQDIYTSYNKFVGAAQNANDLASANQWLDLSLKNLARTTEEYNEQQLSEFNQDQQNAVNDAIKLNDLLLERQQLMNQMADQIRGVLSQGSLQRQATRAQTAGEQIAQIKLDTDKQLQQLNAEIATTQYKVASEQQIFNLATTRIGLEMQLVGLQNDQTDRDMVRIEQLQQLVAGLKDVAGFAPGVLANVQKGYSSAAGTPMSMQDILDEYFAAAYASRSAYGYGAFRGQNL